ncbi:hypothetical protein ULMA_05690 [Patiriisocius marinus]|uniref:Uncharacterized protein n=1 Tax=Patiriisocius marinus TaxID=1397112 RepID=A0A5J4IY10_9FLAO|nr:zinc-dependent metalloprotease [Patiriisocius marinus]GER58461.1 hypothetical protein ULMA_05690 [Patiriisocius marinus]
MKAQKYLLSFVFTFTIFFFSAAQSIDIDGCGTDYLHIKEYENNAVYKRSFDKLNVDAFNFLKDNKSTNRISATPSKLTVIIHDLITPGQDPVQNYLPVTSMDDYSDIIINLNQHFSSTNIEFCLAKKDALNETIAIEDTRYETDIVLFDMDIEVHQTGIIDETESQVETSSTRKYFPVENYINIYVVTQIKGPVAGFSTLPGSVNNPYDGIFIERNQMYGSSKTLVHEMGHYLGLLHTFGLCDYNAEDDCFCENTDDNDYFYGDMIPDTPAHLPATGITGAFCNQTELLNSLCSGEDDSQIENITRNYMNYYNGSCRDLFTPDQISRMQWVIDPFEGPRKELLNTNSCVTCDDINDCEISIIAVDNSAIEIEGFNSIQINDLDAVSFLINTDCNTTDSNYNWELINLESSTIISSSSNTIFTIPNNVTIGNYNLQLTLNSNAPEECLRIVNYNFQITTVSATSCKTIIDNHGWTINGNSTTPEYVEIIPADTFNHDYIIENIPVGLDILRVGPDISNVDDLGSNETTYVSYTFKPTEASARYRVYFAGMTEQTQSFTYREPNELFSDYYPATFGWFCSYDFNNPLVSDTEPNTVLNEISIGDGSVGTSSLNEESIYTYNDLVVNNTDAEYQNQHEILNTQTIDLTPYDITRSWEFIDIDFSEFINSSTSTIDDSLDSTEITITFFARSGAGHISQISNNSVGFFAIDCLGAGLPQHVTVEQNDIYMACSIGESSCFSTTAQEYPFTGIDTDNNLANVELSSVDYPEFNSPPLNPISNPTNTDLTELSSCITNFDEDTQTYNNNITQTYNYVLTLNTMHQTISEAFQVSPGYYYDDPVLPPTACDDQNFVGGDVIEDKYFLACSDDETTYSLALTSPCFPEPHSGYSYRWNVSFTDGPQYYGEKWEDFKPNQYLNSTYCSIKVTREVRYQDDLCYSEWIPGESFIFYNKNNYRSNVSLDIEPSEVCYTQETAIAKVVTNIFRPSCYYDLSEEDQVIYQALLDEEDLDESGEINYSAIISGNGVFFTLATHTVEYTDGYNEDQFDFSFNIPNVEPDGTPLFPGNYSVFIRANSTFNDCLDSSVATPGNIFDISLDSHLFKIRAIPVAGGITNTTAACNVFSVSDNGDYSYSGLGGSIYQWQFDTNSSFSSPTIIVGETSADLNSTNTFLTGLTEIDFVGGAEIWIRRVSLDIPDGGLNDICPELNQVAFTSPVQLLWTEIAPVLFSEFDSICLGDTTFELPTTDANGNTGTWNTNPNITDLGVHNYYFNPTNECLETTLVQIETIDCCLDCEETTAAITIEPSGDECGVFIINHNYATGCYIISANYVNISTNPVQVSPAVTSAIDESQTIIQIDENGTFNINVTLQFIDDDGIKGKCRESKTITVDVSCFSTVCEDCDEASDSITFNKTACDEYTIFCPQEIIDCYAVYYSYYNSVGIFVEEILLVDEETITTYPDGFVSNNAFFYLVNNETGETCESTIYNINIDCSNPCDDLLPDPFLEAPVDNISAATAEPNYIDYVNITATNKILSGATSTYKASESIHLLPGFHAQNGSIFHAYIEACISPSPSRDSNAEISEEEIILNGGLESELSVYPNPAKDVVNITHPKLDIVSYQLYNAQGRLIKTSANINSNNHSFNSGVLSRGLYFLRVTLEEGAVVHKKIIFE